MTITCDKRLSNGVEENNLKTEFCEENSLEMKSDNLKPKKAKKRKGETIGDKNSKSKKKSTLNGIPDEQNDPTDSLETEIKSNDAEGNVDSGEDETEKITDKEARQISGKTLRASFNSSDGLTLLKKFITICNDNKKVDLAAQYLDAGGSPLEILKLLDATDKKNLGNATTVFSAMEIVIIKILEKYPQYNSSASEACRHLLNSHLSSIHSMLASQSNAKQRKVVLRLLTAVVSLGGNLPRELLGHLSLHSQVLETLSKHTQPSDMQSVRTSFIHFILSFLVEGNVSVVRALLDKRGSISCIFPELIYDTHNLVHLVLTTIKSYVLENQGISKTIKLHTFSTPVIQNLVSLYNWKGPKNWTNKNRKKQEETSGLVDPDEKKVVVEIVHEFLLTLLTSNKFGIIFHDRSLGTSGQRNNQLADTILQSLDRPWEHAKPSDLVVKILVACPDLIKAQLLYTESYLEPTASSKWILLMGFIKQVLESLDPEVCFKPSLTELNTPQLFAALTTLTVPIIVLKNAIAPSLNHENIVVRHTGVILLTVMLKQLNSFMNTVRNNSVEQSEISKIENLITDYLLKNIPTLDSVLIAWNKILTPEKEKEEGSTQAIPIPTRKESLTAILDLLLTYRDTCVGLLETSSASNTSVDSTTLLKGLNTLDNIEEEELEKMKVKALQFLLALDPSAFIPEKELFGEAVPFLISLLETGEKSTPVSSHARTAIKLLLNNCGAFEGCNYQSNIWISSCLDLDRIEDRIEIANWLVKVIRKTTKHSNKYVKLVTKAEETGGEQLYSKTTIEDIFTDLMERDMEIGRNRTAKLLPVVSISPLLVAALENAKSDGRLLLLDYLSRVTVHSLHCQVSPNALINIIKNVEQLSSRLYISSWEFNGEHMNIKKAFGSKSQISKLSKALITSSELDLNKIFEGDKKVSFRIADEELNFNHSMNADEILASLRLSLFYFTRLTQEEKLTEELNSNVKIILASLLHAVKGIENIEDSSNLSEECCKWILSHPVMLQYFSPLYKKKNSIEKYCTEMVAYICPTIVELFVNQKTLDLLVPFKDKFITKLQSSLNKVQNGSQVKDCLNVVRFVEILQLNIEDIIELLTTMLELKFENLITSDKSRLSMWGMLIPKLLDATVITRGENSDQRRFLTLDKSLIEKISQFLIKLSVTKNEGFDSWVDSLLVHLKKFPHNIAGIDKNLFLSLIKRKKMSPSTIQLSSFLISRNSKFISAYVKYSLNNVNVLKNKDAVFTILSNMLENDIREEFLKKLYHLYKNEILRWFSDPETVDNCIKENINAAVKLIETTIDAETLQKTCEIILSNGDKLLTVDESYIKLLKVVFTKASKVKTAGDNRLVDFAQILIHIIVSSLKKDSKNSDKHNSLCETLLDVLNLIKIDENDTRFHEIRKNHSWPQFTRFSLKLGIKNSNQFKLLKTLVKLCNVVYENDCDDEYVNTLFQMTTSHSEFINVMLGSSSAKRDLVELLLVLVKKKNSLMVSIHVPLYLGAYNATLSETDQLILQLLQYYETHKIRLTDYRPYLWGSAAASHYSVKSGTDAALWRQPSTSQVLDLFLQETVNNTVKNYPINRKLKSTELHPSQSTYDPAFYLPLLCYLLSDNSVVACHKITQSGALALALSACGSTDKDTRLAALTVVSRFYYHLEATNSKEKLLWLHFIDTFRNGIYSANPELLEDVKLSCLVTTFMARTSLVATQPLNPLYSPLQKFLMAKPALDLSTIPEFLQLFHSSEIDYKIHRSWILEVVRDGLKTNMDMEVAFKCVLFKMLLSFYSCVLADRQAKNLILQVINSAVKIPNACVLLVTGYGLVPWLNEIIYSFDTNDDIDFVPLMIDVIHHIFKSLEKSTENNGIYYFMLLRTMINLRRHISCKNTDIESYKNYLSTFQKIISVKAIEFCKYLSLKDISDLVNLSKTILGEVNECEDILKFGSKYSKKISNTIFHKNNHTAKDYLKKLLMVWCSDKEI